jgi:outer membrane protein
MKKISLALALVLSVTSADLLSVSAGAGYEQQNISGYVKKSSAMLYLDKSGTNNLGLKDENNPYVWIKFIHPVPLIPNIKAQYTKYDTSGYGNANVNVKLFGDVNLNITGSIHTTQTINSYDVTFFYEIKPVVADIEAGFGLDLWQGHTKVVEKNTLKVLADNDWTVPLPYLYAHVETMQFFGFSVIADAKWAKAGDNHHYDYQGALKYTIDILGPVNPFIKAGYRYKEVYGVDGDNETLLKYKGAFLEIGAKF